MENINQKLNFQYNSSNQFNINANCNNNLNSSNNKKREYIYKYNINKEKNETNSNDQNFYLINEINDLKKKYLMAKEKLEIAINQKEKDSKYIENLEKQLIKKHQSERRNEKYNFNSKKKNITSNYEKDLNEDEIKSNKSMIVDVFRNSNYNYNQKLRNSRSNISDFSLFDNNSFSSFQNDTNTKNNNTQIDKPKNIIGLKKNYNINKKVPIPTNIKKSNRKKRNNSVISDKANKSIIIENSQNNKFKNSNISNNNINSNNSSNKNKMNKLFTFKESIENENENDFQTSNDSNEIINTNKIIIRNCNCIINLNPQSTGNNNYIQLFHNSNIKKNIIEKKEKKNDIDKMIEERYLIVDKKQKPIFIKGKQILGMNLIPLKGDNDEIIYDNKNKIFLYDLDGALHNQNELKNIILDNGLPLVNGKNIPILGLNNIPIIDQYGDFLLGKGPLNDGDNNYINGVYSDVLRDKENKPIKIMISKKQTNYKNNNSNQENEIYKIFNKFYHKNTNKSQINNKLTNNNPVIEIEIKPNTKLITNRNSKNQVNDLKKYRRNKSPFNDINKFNFEKSLRNYNDNATINKKYHYKRNNSNFN